MTGHRIVVAGAVLDRDRLLLAQRRYPPDLAGLWELPGGKVEAGESPADALRRELREELGVTIAVGAAHMVGEDGLVALLEAKGYRVTRLR